MSKTRQQQAEELRQQGNDCVKGGNYNEAVIHYSHALKQDPNNHFIYSNRSLTFLKLQQYYLAEQDAIQTIKLQPKWPKGYFRKGEVEFQVGHYSSALLSYGQALLLDPSNKEVQQAVSRTNDKLVVLRKKKGREPWLFCGVGAMIGLLIVLADKFLTDKPSIQNIIIQCLMVMTFSSLGYGALRIYRYISDSQTRSLLEPPVDLLNEMGTSANNDLPEEADTGDSKHTSNNKQTESKPHRKGGVSAARQRYKKGKT
ncbi:hsp70-Hsp90 organising protein-like isoform X2 [Mercenaria mercenaria]|uniref:hsp70-Hsp90 organising protein-like isoform X2 n=1 Tax=Mercenaria mercenaria TaxID=6596 RepID=UPI00234F6045|nr:hsp70-Hsp90 organising protein-like isoform X2 [Mercenaria mercenaria]